VDDLSQLLTSPKSPVIKPTFKGDSMKKKTLSVNQKHREGFALISDNLITAGTLTLVASFFDQVPLAPLLQRALGFIIVVLAVCSFILRME
jgi:hypothetical protein